MATNNPVWTGVLEARQTPPLATVVGTSTLASIQGTVTVAAGGAAVFHVAQSVTFSLVGIGLSSTTVGLFVIDGVSGGTTYLFRTSVAVGSIGITPVTVYLNRPGTINTALTAEFSALVTGATQMVDLGYYDIGV